MRLLAQNCTRIVAARSVPDACSAMHTSTSAEPSTPSPERIALNWLDRLGVALSNADAAPAFARLLLPDGYLRDQVLLSWDLRTLQGRQAIETYVAYGLSGANGAAAAGGLTNVTLDKRAGLAPTVLAFDQPGAVQLAFTLDSKVARARGSARLFASSDDSSDTEWLAGSVFLMLDALKGHEELGAERGIHGEGGIRTPWADVKDRRWKVIKNDPYVLIVGAGQTGLQLSARFTQLGIPTLIIDRQARVGDTWRKRYPSLTLNTPRQHHTLLYSPYPDTWPIYTPKDKFADWLELYAETHDLVVWTSTELMSHKRPTYDAATGRWTLLVLRNNAPVTLNPAHIVLATSMYGAPRMPVVPHAKVFPGRVIHAHTYQDAAGFAAQRVLVVGSANTGADICGDLVGAGARVTMLQRGPTSVIFSRALRALYDAAMPFGAPSDVVDFLGLAMPTRLREHLTRTARKAALVEGRDPDGSHADDLRRKQAMVERGYLFSDGPDGTGIAGELNKRFAGHLVEAGLSDLLMADRMAIKSGTELAQFTDTGVEFQDGTTLDVDAVIFATGYEASRNEWKSLFGDDVIEKAGQAWGLDEEGELRGQYRPTGHPGLWFAGGDFAQSRWMSKGLGLVIQAHYLGLRKP